MGTVARRPPYSSNRNFKIAFNPLYEGEDTPFAVLTPVIEKDSRWISDIAEFFAPDFDSWSFVNDYIQANPDCNPIIVNSRITDLKAIATRRLGCIVVAAECSIDEVTDIFIRINSKGAVLSQADFAMSKIAADEARGGNMLRKAIDYYCHLSIKPEFWTTITENDAEFMTSEYATKAAWLKDDRDDIYDPDYNDVLRVAFMHMFRRGKLADLVSLLSGRDFKERDFKSEIADDSFARLHDGVIKFMHKGNFQDFTAALRSAGFISPAIIGSKGAVNFAYNLYLTLKEDGPIPSTDVKRWVQRWYVMSVLTGRYSGSSESIMDRDMRGIADRSFVSFYNEIAASQLSDNFWSVTLPQNLTTTSTRTGAWMVYVASQVRAADNTLFTKGFKVADVIGNVGDIHHIFPKAYLRKEINAPQRLHNQIANYTYLEKRINIAIGEKSPGEYFSQARAAIIEGKPYFGDISDEETLASSLKTNCIPEGVFHMTAEDYETFLVERRTLMAQKIRRYFEGL